jgi:hypothetical protein
LQNPTIKKIIYSIELFKKLEKRSLEITEKEQQRNKEKRITKRNDIYFFYIV